MRKRGIVLVLIVLFSCGVLGLVGDFNENGCVEFEDFLMFAKAFGDFYEGGTYDGRFDLNDDENISIEDFFIFAEGYGECEKKEVPVGENKKNKYLYKEKQVFLISDKNWKDVLQLVPLTTWTVTEGHPDLEWCNVLKNEDRSVRVFNEKDEDGNDVVNYVCGYPMLIYHEEEEKFEENIILPPFLSKSKVLIDNVQAHLIQDYRIGEITFSKTKLNVGDTTTISFSILNPDDKILHIDEISIIYWPYKGYLEPINSNTIYDIDISPKRSYSLNFEFKLNSVPEGIFKGFDADSIIYFMQQYSPDKVIIIGETPQELEDLIIKKELTYGAQLGEDKLQRIKIYDSTNEYVDYLSHWHRYNKLIYVQDNYKLALMASTYASLINAPLIVKNSDLDRKENLQEKQIICVSDIKREDCSGDYDLEELQKKYIELTNTDKIILVNPNDLNIRIDEFFNTEKSNNFIFDLYSKTSLSAPILAAGKHEIMTFVHNYNYENVDQEFTHQFLDLYNFEQSDFNVLECIYGQSCSTEREVYTILVKESIDDVVTYRFDINENLDNIQEILLSNLVVEDSCKNLKENLEININDMSYKPLILKVHQNVDTIDFWIRVREEQLSTKPIKPVNGEKELYITLKIPGCKIIRLLNPEKAFLKINGRHKYYDPLQETNVIDNTLLIYGLNPGNIAYFRFKNMNPDLDYFIVTTPDSKRTVYVEDKVNNYITSDKITNGKLEIKIKADEKIFENSILPYRILPLKNVKLYPQLQDFYLTIFASPDAIQMSSDEDNSGFRFQLDGSYETLNSLSPRYGSSSSKYTRLISGRIFGLTLSDVSSLVARILFFDGLPKDKSASFIFRGTSPDDTIEYLIESYKFDHWWISEDNIYKEFPDRVFRCYSYYDPLFGCDTYEEETKQKYLNTYFSLYDDHGWYDWAFIDSTDLIDKYLQPKTNYIIACATCDFGLAKEKGDTKNLFCAQNLRKGGINYIGAQSIAWLSPEMATRHFIPSLVIEKNTIGKAWEMKKRMGGNSGYFILLGDPTFRPIYWGKSKK